MRIFIPRFIFSYQKENADIYTALYLIVPNLTESTMVANQINGEPVWLSDSVDSVAVVTEVEAVAAF
jgi:hypothetical protein